MKKTAVEWLVEQMIYQMDIRIENTTIGCELFEQAKEMEKEQIVEAYRTGVEEDVYERPLRTGKQYYNETFKAE